jgi:hypothetical protein
MRFIAAEFYSYQKKRPILHYSKTSITILKPGYGLYNQ